VSLIAGILILIGAIYVMVLMSVAGSIIGGFGVPGVGGLLVVFGAIGLIFSIIVLLGAVMLWMKPQSHVAWGVLILLFSLFSIITGGGFLIGLVLGIVGGILGIVWKPPMVAPAMAPPMPPQ